MNQYRTGKNPKLKTLTIYWLSILPLNQWNFFNKYVKNKRQNILLTNFGQHQQNFFALNIWNSKGFTVFNCSNRPVWSVVCQWWRSWSCDWNSSWDCWESYNLFLEEINNNFNLYILFMCVCLCVSRAVVLTYMY